jgi:hypothetical protein
VINGDVPDDVKASRPPISTNVLALAAKQTRDHSNKRKAVAVANMASGKQQMTRK